MQPQHTVAQLQLLHELLAQGEIGPETYYRYEHQFRQQLEPRPVRRKPVCRECGQPMAGHSLTLRSAMVNANTRSTQASSSANGASNQPSIIANSTSSAVPTISSASVQHRLTRSTPKSTRKPTESIGPSFCGVTKPTLVRSHRVPSGGVFLPLSQSPSQVSGMTRHFLLSISPSGRESKN